MRLDGNPVDCEFSLRSFFDEYEEPLLYAIFGDTRITFHAVKTGPNSASVKLSFRHSFEWKDIMRNDLEKFFDTPQEKSGWIYRSTKLVGNISDENYELEVSKATRIKYAVESNSSGEAATNPAGGFDTPQEKSGWIYRSTKLVGNISDENYELNAANAVRIKYGAESNSSGEAATNPTGGLVSGSGEAATNPTGGPTGGTAGGDAVSKGEAPLKPADGPSLEPADGVKGPPALNALPGGENLLRNRIFDAFLRRAPGFNLTVEDMALFARSQALRLQIKAYKPAAEPRHARLVFEADKDAVLFYAFGEAEIMCCSENSGQDGAAPAPEAPADGQKASVLPPFRLTVFHQWEWADLSRNGFQMYFPGLKQRSEYAFSSFPVLGAAVISNYPADPDDKRRENAEASAPQAPAALELPSFDSEAGRACAKFKEMIPSYTFTAADIKLISESTSVREMIEQMHAEWVKRNPIHSSSLGALDKPGESELRAAPGESQEPTTQSNHQWSVGDILQNKIEQISGIASVTLPIAYATGVPEAAAAPFPPLQVILSLLWPLSTAVYDKAKTPDSPEKAEQERKVLSGVVKAALTGTTAVDVTKIPSVMDANKMEKGATLMRKWLNGNGETDTKTITIDWAIENYDRARNAYNKIIREKTYVNAAAQEKIIQLAKRQGVYDKGGKFGCVSGDPVALDDDSIQFESVSAKFFDKFTDPLDDMFTALGAFTMKVLVEGNITKPGSKDENSRVFTISQIGIYIKDSYDFNDKPFNTDDIRHTTVSQPLGFWDTDNNNFGRTPLSGKYVDNETFRDYREKTGKGRDFMIYSDIKAIEFPTPVEFTVEYIK